MSELILDSTSDVLAQCTTIIVNYVMEEGHFYRNANKTTTMKFSVNYKCKSKLQKMVKKTNHANGINDEMNISPAQGVYVLDLLLICSGYTLKH